MYEDFYKQSAKKYGIEEEEVRKYIHNFFVGLGKFLTLLNTKEIHFRILLNELGSFYKLNTEEDKRKAKQKWQDKQDTV
jgi:hypothetical protein